MDGLIIFSQLANLLTKKFIIADSNGVEDPFWYQLPLSHPFVYILLGTEVKKIVWSRGKEEEKWWDQLIFKFDRFEKVEESSEWD